MTSILNFKDDQGKLLEVVKINKFQELFGDQKWDARFNKDNDFYQYLNLLPGNEQKGTVLYLNVNSLIAMCVLYC
mgnify:CR=1 FL=1